MRRCLLSLLVLSPLLAVGTARGEDRFDRFERLSQASTMIAMQTMVDMNLPEDANRADLDAMISSYAWDETFRTAGRCMLDALDADIGAEGFDATMDEMAAFIEKVEAGGMSPIEIDTARMSAEMHGLDERRAMQISVDYGMLAAQMTWMRESGFLDALIASADGN